MIPPTHVDLAFPVTGPLPRDHGYGLYSALCRALPAIHGADWIGIQNIPGRELTPELIEAGRGSYLRLRVPTAKIGELLPLAGVTIEIQGRPLTLGAPSVHSLRPAAALDARLVVIRQTGGIGKPFDRAAFDERFLAEARRQLSRLEVHGELWLRGRSSLQVGKQRIIGHAVTVGALSADHSLRLQIHGLGGKRTMGCGIFRPVVLKGARGQAEPAR